MGAGILDAFRVGSRGLVRATTDEIARLQAHHRQRMVTKHKGVLDLPHYKFDPRDPRILGYDKQLYDALGIITQESDILDYASSGIDSANLSRNRLITAIGLVADPYQHDNTTATITPVEDAADKVISGLSIAGGPTYFSLSSTLLFLKALSAMNKAHYPAIAHENLPTAVANDQTSRQAWWLPFGVLNDLDPFDASAGIPAEDETSLLLQATFGANNIIAATAADGTMDTATDIYVVTFGVQGMPPAYRNRLPIPDFRHDHFTAPTSTTTLSLLTQRCLKRTTIVNLAVAASNNEPRNDSNMTDISLVFNKPTRTTLMDRMRWQVAKSMMTATNHSPVANRDGTVAVSGSEQTGVVEIDWRKLTHNPFGLNLYPFQMGDVQIVFTLGTTTGSLHIFNEYYALPDPTVYLGWPAFRPQ